MKNVALICCSLLIFVSLGLAQEMPKPGPEHKKLDMFAGIWTIEGDVKPGPMGPGGHVTENEKCEWMEGQFFLVCHTDFKTSMGNGSGISVMGYSSEDKTYTYREFNSWGEFNDSKGSFDGNSFVWTSDEKMGEMTVKGRFTMKITSPTTYDFLFESSKDGTQWTTVLDGKAKKS